MNAVPPDAPAPPARSPSEPPRLRRDHFALLYAGMLVAAAGNTALQSVMPAIGRQMGMNDVWVAIAYTWSAVLWVLTAPYWARQSDRRGRKPLTLLGIGGFVISMTLCGAALAFGLAGFLSGVATFAAFALVRGIYGAVGSATPSAVQAYVAQHGSEAILCRHWAEGSVGATALALAACSPGTSTCQSTSSRPDGPTSVRHTSRPSR